jgi:hypothetical protein
MREVNGETRHTRTARERRPKHFVDGNGRKAGHRYLERAVMKYGDAGERQRKENEIDRQATPS